MVLILGVARMVLILGVVCMVLILGVACMVLILGVACMVLIHCDTLPLVCLFPLRKGNMGPAWC